MILQNHTDLQKSENQIWRFRKFNPKSHRQFKFSCLTHEKGEMSAPVGMFGNAFPFKTPSEVQNDFFFQSVSYKNRRDA